MPTIFFRPWVGSEYEHHDRLLVLGEPHYSTKHADERELTRRVLVVGREVWNNMPDAPRVELTRASDMPWPARRYIVNDRAVLATYVHHPASRGFRSAKWADVAAALRASA